MDNRQTLFLNVSFSTFLRILLVAFAILVVWSLIDIVLLLFLSMILAAAISPWITTLARRRIPRPVGVLIVYTALLAVFVAIVVLLVPAITREAASIAANFPEHYKRFTDFFLSKGAVDSGVLTTAKDAVTNVTRGLFAGLKDIAGGFASFLLVLVITFYFTVDEENLRRFWIRMVPSAYRDRLVRVTRLVEERIGNWFRGQLTISVAIAALSYLVLTIIGIPNALLLAIIAGVAAFIPLVGLAIGAIPAVFVALTVSVTKATIVLVFVIALYQLVGNVLVPKVMSKAVGLNPVVIILVMLLGADLAGMLGLVLAIPVASIIDAFVREWSEPAGVTDAA